MEKRCIYHYTAPIEEHPGKGSVLRPRMMLQAFRNIGYHVDAVVGYGAERKAKIQEIKENIKRGVKYDFLYAESRNIPVMLAEEDHIPRHPFMDFSFLHFCRRSGIPIGFFLRDVYWKFPEIYKKTGLWKNLIEIPMYSYDLWQYRRLADRFYVPTKRMQEYILKDYRLFELPPGAKLSEEIVARRRARQYTPGKLKIFYVGMMTELCDISAIVKTVQNSENLSITICTPEQELTQYKAIHGEVSDYDRIQVIHKKSHELPPYYDECDVAALYFVPSLYRSMSVPIKLLEYVQYGVPIIANDNTAAADFIKKYDIGWIVDNDSQLRVLLEHLAEYPEEVREKTTHVLAAIKNNTWECRAEQVRKDLYS